MTFDVVYMINGKCKEILHRNIAKPLAYFLRNQAKDSTHKTGLVMVVKNGTYK